jgi:GDP-4-dehydro-6-deoxy-D-mannose reductase
MQAYDRLLVTGADGFVGYHLLSKLRAVFPGSTLIAATRHPKDLPPSLGRIAQVSFDLLQPGQCADMIAEVKPDGLVHLAAQASVPASFADPLATWKANLIGSIALADAVMRHVPKCRFILASSAEIYGLSFRAPDPLDESAPLCPANPYAASKAACDLAIGEMSLRGLNAIRLRAFNQTGAGQSDRFAIAAFARQIALIEAGLQEPVLRVGDLTRWRDFLDVSDVCAAYAAALSTDHPPSAVYNIASGTARRMGDILDTLIAHSTVKPRVETEAVRLRPTDVERTAGNASRAYRELGWAPAVRWDATLKTVLDDWRSRIR